LIVFISLALDTIVDELGHAAGDEHTLKTGPVGPTPFTFGNRTISLPRGTRRFLALRPRLTTGVLLSGDSAFASALL